MDSYILFIFEGERTEFQITTSLTKHFLNENIIIKTAFCNDIYELYKEINVDDDLDTFLLIKGINKDNNELNNLRSSDFSQIYLFFDYDGHDDQASDEKIIELLNLFKEETEKGKLYISYPMVEALKHFSTNCDFKDLSVSAKENIEYKKIVEREIDEKYRHYNKYDRRIWQILIDIHIRKMNYIVNDTYSIPTQIINQLEIFSNQKIKFIDPSSSIAVLSPFPILIFEYYGVSFIRSLTC